MEKYIKDIIAPKLQGDGGWVDFVSFEYGVVAFPFNEKTSRCDVEVKKLPVLTLQFQGECSKCLILDRCIEWIKGEIKRDLDIDCEIEAIRKKPFFWDK